MDDRRTRLLRKRRNRVTRLLGGEGAPVKRIGPLYWSRRNFSWWIGTLFMIGSTCFAAGTVIAVSENPKPAGIVFFIGSIFFTSAGYGQLLEVLNADGDEAGRVKLMGIRRHDIEWQATFVQFIGTLCFNVSTFAAMISVLDEQQVKRFVWSPDVYGSICFLVASWLAYAEVRANWHGRPERGSEWWVTVLNLVGSIAFGISALGAYVVPDTGALLNAAADNGGTFIGAVCFFTGAYLLWPEAAEAAAIEAGEQA
ncbi:MAG: hypothetical protein ACRDKI_09795 [Solirubrobacterales bacterium]